MKLSSSKSMMRDNTSSPPLHFLTNPTHRYQADYPTRGEYASDYEDENDEVYRDFERFPIEYPEDEDAFGGDEVRLVFYCILPTSPFSVQARADYEAAQRNQYRQALRQYEQDRLRFQEEQYAQERSPAQLSHSVTLGATLKHV